MLGAVFAVLSAATFALNNTAARRGVITGTAVQGMAITVPVGVVCFLPLALLMGAAGQLPQLSSTDAGWMTAVGLLHFVVGRYCNYSASQAAGVNLTAPVIQLQVVVTLVLAVVVLHEPCTVLQVIGGVVMLAGAFITQQQWSHGARKSPAGPTASRSLQAEGSAASGLSFIPRRAAGYLFASLAALAYGVTPIMARTALEHSGAAGGILGGLIAYIAATAAIAAALASRPLRYNVMALKRENVRWFMYSGVFVAAAQGLFYSAVAVAPIMLVVPLMQLSLIFRLIFAWWLNRDHEMFDVLVIVGSVISIAGACAISIDTDLILDTFCVPEPLAHLLRWRI
jgi:drug/metabolite transporter (DMT)-like permease